MKLNRLKKILTNQYFILTVITLLALFIRVLKIDKPLGLWYDEMLAYKYASQSSLLGIVKMLWHEDFHMPLYFMFLHLWMKLFGNADSTLRFASVFWGTLTIPAFFYLGKAYKAEKLGYLMACIGCLSPIMIYFSQEVRFYSMLMVFSTLSIIFFLRLVRTPNKKDMMFFVITNLIILYTYTMGIVFVGTEILILLIHFYLYKKDYFKGLIKNCLIFFLLAIPYFALLINNLYATTQSLLDPFADFGIFDYKNLPIIVNDWFSPFIKGLLELDLKSYSEFLTSTPAFLIFSFMCLPTICFITGFVSFLRDLNKEKIYLLIIPTVFICVELFLCSQGSFSLLTKYTLILLPIIFLFCLDGLLSMKTNTIRNLLIGIIFVVFIYNAISYRRMISHSSRNDGLDISAAFKQLKAQDNDYLLVLNDSKLYTKYLGNLNFIQVDVRGILFQDKTKKEALKVFDKEFVKTTNKHNSLEKFTPFLISTNPTKELEMYINENINKIPKGKKLYFIANGYKGCTPSEIRKFFNDYQIQKTDEDKIVYKHNIYYFIVCKILNDIETILDQNSSLKIVMKTSEIKKQKCRLLVYEKL